jgi:hypothetical protein
MFLNGIDENDQFNMAVTIPNGNIYIFNVSSGGSPSTNWSPDQIAYAFFGGGLSPAKITSLYTIMNTMLATLGAPNVC